METQTNKINDIEEPRCSFEISKLLKQKGFKAVVNSYYLYDDVGKITKDGDYHINSLIEDWNSNDISILKMCSRPTHALAIEWLRLNFNIHIYAFPVYISKAIGLSELTGYCFHANRDFLDDEYDSHQEAVEAALLTVLKRLN